MTYIAFVEAPAGKMNKTQRYEQAGNSKAVWTTDAYANRNYKLSNVIYFIIKTDIYKKNKILGKVFDIKYAKEPVAYNLKLHNTFNAKLNLLQI